MKILRSRENIPLFIAATVVLTAVLAWLAPTEATLGEAVKLVYVHAALMWVGFALVTGGGAAGALYALWRRDALIVWSSGMSVAGILLFLATGLLGMWTARVTWGAVFWGEPRMLMLGQILGSGLLATLAGRLSGSKIVVGAANLSLAVIAWVLVLRTERIIHPVSPIFSSDSTAIKVFPLLITVIIAFGTLLAVGYWATADR